MVNAVQATATAVSEPPSNTGTKGKRTRDKTIEDQIAEASPDLVDLIDAVRQTCLSFGDDVQEKTLKHYLAFTRLRNFVTVEVRKASNLLLICVKVDPDSIDLEDGFTRDLREVGHWGTGKLEITLRGRADLEKALPLLQSSYDGS